MLTAGTYTVMVTDANMCTSILSRTLSNPSLLSLSIAKINPTCPPGSNPPFNSDGSLTPSVTGGTIPYIYDWADISPSTNDPANRTNLPIGTYTLTVTDNNGCTTSMSSTLTNTRNLPSAPAGINNN